MDEFNLKINVTEDCILDCKYCPQEHNQKYFKLSSVDGLINFLKLCGSKPRIDFFGGEPLLNFRIIRTIINKCKAENIPVSKYELITNGLLAKKKVLDFLGENNCRVNFSFDGIREVQDKNRSDKNGSISTYEKVIESIRYMRDRGFDYSIYSVYHTNTVMYLHKSIKHLLSFAPADRITINPAVGYKWKVQDFLVLKEQLERLFTDKDILIGEIKKFMYKAGEANYCKSIYLDTDGNLFPSNLFAYKGLSDPVDIGGITEPEEVLVDLLDKQKHISEIPPDQEMMDQFEVLDFVRDIFDLNISSVPETAGAIVNKVIDAECIHEKKKWISITGLCNNNCLFCLDKGRSDTYHKNTDELKLEIKQAYLDDCKKLILSGGDPTTHPDLIELIRYSAGIGFKKIQVVTNGRMFSSRQYTDDIIEAGLSEVTFSIHGFNSNIHDTLTGVPGSFKQVVKGVINVKRHNHVVVNTDTCITKLNYRYLPKTIRFIVEKLGIMEVNLMSMVPAGNAWKNKDSIMYDYREVAPYVKEIIRYCVRKGVVLWLSRFPAKYLKGYEQFIEDPYKLVDEVRGRKSMLTDTKRPECKGSMCNYCSLEPICAELIGSRDLNETSSFDEIIDIDDNTRPSVPYSPKKNYLIRLRPPAQKMEDYKLFAVKACEVADKLKGFDYPNVSVYGIPQCILFRSGLKNINSVVDGSFINDSDDLLEKAEKLAQRTMTKEESCVGCIFNSSCVGIYQNYARLFGFQELLPIKSIELRINNVCNQQCLFCNTDEDAENMVQGKDAAFEKVSEWSEQGYNYLIISGKEPTLEGWLPEMISFAKSKGFLKIELQTNAVNIVDKGYADTLVKKGLTHAFISLHADSEELSNKITRAPLTFNKTLKGIQNLKEVGITINVVVNSLNYRRLHDIVRFIVRNFRIQSIVFSVVAPVLEALENPDIIPKYSDIVPYLKKAMQLCKENQINFRIPSRCGIPICFIEEYKQYHDEYLFDMRFKDTSDKMKIDSCNGCKHYKNCSGIWKEYIKLHGIDDVKPVKNYRDIDINVGKLCNNNCRFCMTQDPAINPRFVEFDDLKYDVLQSAAKGYENVTFLGGEPTIYPQIIDLVDLARRNGFKTIHLVTNGRRLSDKGFLEKLRKSGVNRFSLSVHSHLADIEDYLTSVPGGFNEKLTALKNFVPFTDIVFINIVANKVNQDTIDKSIEFFSDLGFKNFRINSMMSHSGNSKINSEELVPRFRDLAPIIERIVSKYSKVSLGDFPPCVFSKPMDLLKNIGEYSLDKDTSNIFYDRDQQQHKEFFHWKERRKNNLKTFGKKCHECRFYSNCEGVWKQYLVLYGDEELSPF